MELTVLGKSPSWQDGGGACSGYLVRAGDFTLVLDCGSGAFARLREEQDYLDVDAVVISHLHADHILDLIPFACALSYSPRRSATAGAAAAARPPLHVPPGGRETLNRVAAAFNNGEVIEKAFAISEYDIAGVQHLGPLAVRFCEVPHYLRAFAVELADPEGRRLTFGADCGPNDALVEFGSATNLLIAEATDPPGSTPDGFRGHMTPREAGELARSAGAERLLVTHYTDEVDPVAVRSEAEAGFGGGVELARSGARFIV